MWTEALILAGVPVMILTLTALLWLEWQISGMRKRITELERRLGYRTTHS